MEAVSFGSLIALAAAFTAFGTAWLTYRKISKDHSKEQETREAKVLQLAKEHVSRVKQELQSKSELDKKDFENAVADAIKQLNAFKASVEKELDHIREKQAGEIRVLGDKIEDLRSELRAQHGKLIDMLTELIRKD